MDSNFITNTFGQDLQDFMDIFFTFQFPEETGNIQSAFSGINKPNSQRNLTVGSKYHSFTKLSFSPKAIVFCQFHQEIEKKYIKNPIDPVDPVKDIF
jgi:hypothetical protein